MRFPEPARYLAVAILVMLGVMIAPPLGAQSPSAVPQFEVTSVKRNTSGASRSSMRLPETGTVSATNAPLRMMINQAYQIGRFELVAAVDGPLLAGGVNAPKFDVEGKPPDTAPPGQPRLMLRKLLADRFNLRMHRETRPTPVYVLTVARTGRLGPDLVASDRDCAAYITALRSDPQLTAPEPRHRNGTPLCIGALPRRPGITFIRQVGPAALIKRQIQAFVDRPLIDATGLTGNYEWTLSFSQNAQDGDAPSVFTAVEEQLGLTLEARTQPYEVLVVDSVDWPTAN